MKQGSMNLKIRFVRTGIMAIIMCGIMSLLVLLVNGGFQAGIFLRWMRNWLIAVCAITECSCHMGHAEGFP